MEHPFSPQPCAGFGVITHGKSGSFFESVAPRPAGRRKPGHRGPGFQPVKGGLYIYNHSTSSTWLCHHLKIEVVTMGIRW